MDRGELFFVKFDALLVGKGKEFIAAMTGLRAGDLFVGEAF